MGLPHVYPVHDLIQHDTRGECPCGPIVRPSIRGDGTVGLVVVHHSLVGREVRVQGRDS